MTACSDVSRWTYAIMVALGACVTTTACESIFGDDEGDNRIELLDFSSQPTNMIKAGETPSCVSW